MKLPRRSTGRARRAAVFEQKPAIISLPSFPSELLHTVLFHARPLDLVALAAVNRHLRRAVPQCIDQAVAKHHVARLPRLTITDDLNGSLFKEFIIGSAKGGFCEGLSLIPEEHPILLDPDSEGAYILCLAIASHHVPAVELLLAKGAPVNPAPTNPRPDPPLFHALKENNLQILRLLLDSGADVTVRSNFFEFSVLHYAIEFCGPEVLKVLKLLLEFGADVEARARQDFTPLGFAAARGECECVRVLLDAGADADAFGIGYRSVLYFACRGGCLDTFRLLIDRGASVNTPSRSRRSSALFAAVWTDNVQFMKTLLEAGADVNWVDQEGMTTLQLAITAGMTASAMLLLDAGANPNIKNDAGSTPLHMLPADITFTKEWEELLDRLIEKGADLQAKDASGKTA
ncbi:hypothetical protein HDU96_004562 [Phlyctochytrium bullatum]|nr:hypothetical protein HDU96_004562 [Phlyctochytrium bullatum]